MSPKKSKQKTKKQKKALKAKSIKKAEKRKLQEIQVAESDALLSPSTLEAEFDYIKNPEGKRLCTSDAFNPDFEFSVHEQSAESVTESLNGDGCVVELAEAELGLAVEVEEPETGEARKKREIKWIKKNFDENQDEIYKLNQFGKHFPKPKDLPDYQEVPKCPVNEGKAERKGKRGRTPKTAPCCKYCDLVLKSDYESYDHYLKHIQTHNLKCPICQKKFGGLASLQNHMVEKHQIYLSKLKVSKNKKDQEMYKACRKPEKCTEDAQYYLKVSKKQQ